MSGDQNRNLVLTTVCLRALRATPLKKTESIVLWHLVATLSITGEVVSNADTGRELLIEMPNMTRAMKRLCELGFIMRGPKVGVSYHYKLNPAYFRIIS